MLGLLVGLAAIPVARAIGRGVLVDLNRKDPDGRAMPRSGGMGIALAWAVAVLATTHDAAESMRLLALGGFALVVGLHDDITKSSPRWRLAVLGALALNAAALGFRVDAVTLPGGGVWDLGSLALPLSAAWILGTTVAFDFADGIDGLAGGLAAVACLGIAVLAPSGGPALAAGALGGTAIAFFLFNRPPATVYMGDNGSNLLGFAVGALTLSGLGGGEGGLPVFAGLLLIAVPVTDAALTLLRRAAAAPSMFTADRRHIHHHLENRHGTRRALTLLLMTAAVCAVTAGIPGKGALGLLVIGALLYEVRPGARASR